MASFEKRGNSIRAIVRVPGGKKKSATFDTMAQAKAWAKSMEAAKKAGTMKSGDAGTVGDLFEAYLDAVASKTDSAKWNKLRIMKWILDPIAKKVIG